MSKNMTGWRVSRDHVPLRGKTLEPYPATRFFDQLSFIGNANVGCFVLETDDGFNLIDCMEPTVEHRDMIVQGIDDLGLSLANLKNIIITHGHGDHYGRADWFREQTGCTVYMSKADYENALQDFDSPSGALKWEIRDFYDDGDVISQGGQDVYCFATPGHSPGCMSLLIPVTDMGEEHLVALWGGTGVPRNKPDMVRYIESSIYFEHVVEEYDADCEISQHPFVDMLLPRLDIIRTITDGVPNPMIVGNDQVRKAIRAFGEMCVKRLYHQLSEEQ